MRVSHADPVSGELWSMAEELGEIGSFDRDLRSGKARVSDTMCRIFGLDRAALESSEKAWMNRIHPDDRGQVENALRVATADGATNVKFQYRILRNGEVRWISTRLRIVYDAQGAPARRFGVNQDMTDRFSTTIANAHLAAVVESSSEAIKSYALDGTILSWNPGAERLFGYSAKEALGKKIDLILPVDQREEARRKIADVASGGHVRLESRRRRKDGALVDVAISASPVRDALGRVVAVSSLAHDIGPRLSAQRALERYRLLAEHARDILFVLRLRDGAIIETNKAAVLAYGHDRETLLKMNIADLRSPETVGALSEDLARVGEGTLFETIHKRRDGSTFPVEVSAVSMTMDGELMVLSLVRDISERREWARVQRLMTRELLHRVKNSVAVIQSLVRLTAPRARNLEEFVASLSGRLSAMAAAHDLLSEMHWRGADLGELLAKQLAHYLGGQEKRLHMDGPRVRLPQQFAVPLALALHELGTNAAKHGSLSSPTGQVDLTWTYTRGPRDKLSILWRESGGPPVERPTSSGFGSTLIERGLPGARVDRRYEPGGLVCTIDLDLTPARRRAPRARKAAKSAD
ncbi:MAG: PAS domain S-box protein [Beijerinckiaceae bacterium]|nr:PAS domain S-box protein [Beijerinckiaceae bacterium]